MKKLLLGACSAAVYLGLTACPSAAPRASGQKTSIVASSMVEAPDKDESLRWPKGTFLVINDHPISRDIWDAQWKWRASHMNPPPAKVHKERLNRSMHVQTRQIVENELFRQAAVREGIVVTDEDRATLREVFGDGYDLRAKSFAPERSVYPTFDEAMLIPVLLTIRTGDATGTLAEEIALQRRDIRSRINLERRLRARATIKIVGPPESLARVGESHVRRQDCSRPYGSGVSEHRMLVWMHGCVTHHIARTLLTIETGQKVIWPDDALEGLAGPPKPVNDAEAKAFYDANLHLFRDGDVYEQDVVHFLRKDEPTRQQGVRTDSLPKRFAKAVAAGEPFLPLALSYQASGDAVIKREVVPVPDGYDRPDEAYFKTGDVSRALTSYDGTRIRKIVERRPGPFKPFDREAVRTMMYEREKRALLHALIEKADIEVYEEGLELKWPDDRALPENPRLRLLRRR